MNQFEFGGWAFTPEIVNDWGKVDSVFSAYECERIIEYGESLNVQAASVGGQKTTNTEIRDSKTSWIHPRDESATWIFQRVAAAVTEINAELFKFDLWGFMEALQFTRYDAPGGKYDTHVDRFNGSMVVRKLSLSILLTDPNKYEGGDLDVYVGGKPQKLIKQRGALIAFPSFILHGVTPVTKGTRHSLVGWATGKPFK
jgi:PKHD-type hydroxylase